LKTKGASPKISPVKGSEISLAGPALVQLVLAVLEKGTPVRFQAKGFSMSPFIKNEDVVTITPLRGKRLGLGEIIAFVHPETRGLCIHRMVRKEDGFYVTKGDNRSETNEWVPRESLLGSVTKVERNGKPVFLGLGPERFVISYLGRRGLLFPLLLPVWKVMRAMIRRPAR
jgi:signal peptidase I